MTVLLVEDHADTRSVLEMLLNRCGCQTVTARSLKDARARLKEMSFDMLISDLNLPDGDGLDLVCEAKHKCTSSRRLPLRAEHQMRNTIGD
jgi:DNA-binding response OmpR family regulator